MQPPAPADQIRFLTNVQRLLAEGLFTATYKYALIAALADLSVESGDDSGGPLLLMHVRDCGEVRRVLLAARRPVHDRE